MRTFYRRLGLSAACCVLLLGAGTGLAAEDSSADRSGGFVQTVQRSEAVILRVPVNERGEELTSAAELRLHDGEALQGGAQIKSAFERGMDLSQQRQLSESAIESDSSTFGWRPYRYNWGWRYNYYYSYRPYYYYYGNYWNYGNPYYYNYYYPSSYHWGYRYYYYPRYW